MGSNVNKCYKNASIMNKQVKGIKKNKDLDVDDNCSSMVSDSFMTTSPR